MLRRLNNIVYNNDDLVFVNLGAEFELIRQPAWYGVGEGCIVKRSVFGSYRTAGVRRL